jgi:hypothetical protein
MNTNTSMLANEMSICDSHGPQANTYEQRHVVFMCLHRWQRYVRNKAIRSLTIVNNREVTMYCTYIARLLKIWGM